MPLADCSAIHGNTTLFEHDPACASFKDVLYMPVAGQAPEQGKSYGLYQANGALILAAGRFRGPDRSLAGPLLHCHQDRRLAAPAADGPSYIYLGVFTSHYGHFLIDTLCRLWAFATHRQGDKILYHGYETPAQLFHVPFAANLFSALGLTASDFVKFDAPTLLRHVIVPSPAIEELNFSHRILATCFNRIGRLLCPEPPRAAAGPPIYLTKANVKSGISHYVNEAEFIARLAKSGVEIVSPETLPLREQIRIFMGRRIVTGLIGSAFHTALFAPGRQCLILNYGPVVWSNQILIDKANRGASTFVCEAGGSPNAGPNAHFGNNFTMTDPVGLAEEFLRRIDRFDRAPTPAASVTSREPSPAKCAVVLVVKDEAHDIAAWLAWYAILGFDTCIVYDDDSTDGTWDILESASAHQKIRLSRTIGPKPGPYEHRQDDCYRHALSTYRQDFDWLAFFDADEFLLLPEDPDVNTFLARFPNADAVAVNWCNYGSSGHLLKPEKPPFEAYTWHGGAHQPINRHVKSFVRPAKTGPNWLNVHCFDIPADRYVLANGAPVAWSDTGGIISTDPDWRPARLMHYQCRSMEHFVERLKKRPELATIPGIWQASDLHDVQHILPPPLLQRAKARMQALRQRPTANPANATLIFDIGMSEGNDTAFYLAKGFQVVGVEPDAQIFAALTERFETEIATGALKIYNCAASDQAGQIVEFYHHNDHQGLSGLSKDRQEFAAGAYQSYPVLTIDWPTLVKRHGVPYYLKIDTEGHETAFLAGLAATADRPQYISVQCDQLAPAEALSCLGYAHFKLVDQNPPNGFAMQTPQREGNQIDWPTWHHASGPFGRDLPGDWVDYPEFQRQWHNAQPARSRTWFDCHARLGT
jgi:FkbM family methyltransferase